MVGRPKRNALIAAQLAQAGHLQPVDRTRAPKAPKVVTSVPPKTVPIVRREPVDTDLAQLLAAAPAIDANSPINELFEQLRIESFRFALQVMRMELDPDERGFAKLIGTKQQIMTSILTATGRIRPGDLRQADDDGVGQLLAALRSGEELTDEGPTAEDLFN